MNRLSRVGLLTVLCLMSHFVYAESASEVLAQKLTQLHSMQARFSQQILDGKGRIMQQSTGKFALLRPGKFRWEIEQPTQQLLIADGKRIWMYDKDLQQVTIQRQDNRSANSPALLLSGSVTTLKKNFKVNYSNKSDKEGTWFALQPIKKEAMFQSVALYFKGEQLHGMRLIDNLGQASDLTFSHVVNNPTIAANHFTFEPPTGVDVIDQTQH